MFVYHCLPGFANFWVNFFKLLGLSKKAFLGIIFLIFSEQIQGLLGFFNEELQLEFLEDLG